MTTITGLVLTYNGERLLEKCLACLDFCDEILVVDSDSTDTTMDIATRFGARVLTRAWEGPGPQFQYALEHIDSDWVVSLDQDEFLSPELRQEIIAQVKNGAPPEDLTGYY
ncbi:MAG: glycosyltransferase family 2 protein, partial [Proteobacteria bacterium]|nr:glycosyltransferase family 2 protein [Pseudomonadota bacterium]